MPASAAVSCPRRPRSRVPHEMPSAHKSRRRAPPRPSARFRCSSYPPITLPHPPRLILMEGISAPPAAILVSNFEFFHSCPLPSPTPPLPRAASAFTWPGIFLRGRAPDARRHDWLGGLPPHRVRISPGLIGLASALPVITLAIPRGMWRTASPGLGGHGSQLVSLARRRRLLLSPSMRRRAVDLPPARPGRDVADFGWAARNR